MGGSGGRASTLLHRQPFKLSPFFIYLGKHFLGIFCLAQYRHQLHRIVYGMNWAVKDYNMLWREGGVWNYATTAGPTHAYTCTGNTLAPWDIPIFSIVYIFRQSFLGLFSLAQYRPQPYRLFFVSVGGGREEEKKAASTSHHTAPRRLIVRKRCIFYDLQQLFGGTKHYEIFFAA